MLPEHAQRKTPLRPSLSINLSRAADDDLLRPCVQLWPSSHQAGGIRAVVGTVTRRGVGSNLLAPGALEVSKEVDP